jgi:hypothetical protein
LHLAVTTHAHGRHRHALERSHCLLGAVFLRVTEDAVENDNRKDHHRLQLVSQEERENGRGDQDQCENIGELCSQNLPTTASASLHQFVGAKFAQTLLRFCVGKTGGRAAHLLKHVSGRRLVEAICRRSVQRFVRSRWLRHVFLCLL